ncbi:MAG TPA: cytochrome c biogenesis heme-transporting ATPase CcmA [Thiopseudomonas sp.]|nr:cytochrome c biogenesis heme-transporting ATPase CcmA [Thiopseudomonas sp.]
MTDAYLETVDLTCERDWRLLFENLQVSVKPKDMLQVSGPNGSGKTSLLRLMSGLMQPTSGDVLIKGVSIHKQRHELASNLLWLGHAAGIKGLLTAEENLTWLSALHHGADRTQIWQALAAVGLAGFEDVPCHTLSAGQQRRVGLARLYLDAPALWILDEPFTALDKQAVAQLEQHLVEHCNKGGMVILTTHHHLQNVPDTFQELDLGQVAL